MASRFQRREAAAVPDLSARVKTILTKAGVAAGSTDGSTWGSELVGYREISAGFAASLAPWSSYDRIYNDNSFMRVPLKTRISIASSAATGSAISELAPKPISQIGFTLALLEPAKVVAFIVLSNELARSASPASIRMFGNELRRACAVATDTAFLAALSSSTGVASSASTGMSASAFLSDLDTALQAVTVGAGSKLYLIVPPAIWKSIALMRDSAGPIMVDGVIGGIIRVLASDATTDTGYLVDATQVATENGLVELRSAEHATLQMDDDPTSGHNLISLWMNDLVGMRAERWFGCELLRSDGAALVTGMTVTA
jgi:HK97 family phage major capsid protein